MSIPKTVEEMEPWEVLQEAIPRGESDNIAQLLRRRGIECTGQTVRSWRNDPDVDDKIAKVPHGRRNPLDVILDVIAAVGARNGNVETIRQKINHEAARVQADKGREEFLRDRDAVRRAREKAKEFLAETEHFGDG